MAADSLQPLAPAFQLDGVHAGFLQETPGIPHGFDRRGLVGHKGHVANQQGVLRPASHSFAVVQHILHGDRQGVGVAQDHHAERIAYQDGIDAGLVDRQSGGIIIGRQHADDLAVLLALAQGVRGDFFPFDGIRDGN